jgi:hypothetical protein
VKYLSSQDIIDINPLFKKSLVIHYRNLGIFPEPTVRDGQSPLWVDEEAIKGIRRVIEYRSGKATKKDLSSELKRLIALKKVSSKPQYEKAMTLMKVRLC